MIIAYNNKESKSPLLYVFYNDNKPYTNGMR